MHQASLSFTVYVETLEKALGHHFISKMGLTCLWHLESHVEFTASDCDDAWQFINIVRNPNITVSNRKRDLDSHLTSRSVCIFLPRLVYIPELSLIPRQVPDFSEQTRVSNGHPPVTREYTPGSYHNSRKPKRLSPPCEMRPESPALCPEQLIHFYCHLLQAINILTLQTKLVCRLLIPTTPTHVP